MNQTLTIEFEETANLIQVEFESRRGKTRGGLTPSKKLVPSTALKPSRGHGGADTIIKIEWERGKTI